MHLCLLCKRNKSDIVLGAIFIAQDFFSGYFLTEEPYRVDRLVSKFWGKIVLYPMHDRTIFPSLVGAFLFRFKKIAKLKGIPEEDVRRDLYRKKACMQNLFCCDEHIPNSIHYVVQAPCEFSFLDMGPSKCKGVEQNQAPGLSLLGFPWPNNMQYCLLIWT